MFRILIPPTMWQPVVIGCGCRFHYLAAEWLCLSDLFRIAKLLWGVPLLTLALVGLLLPSTRDEGSNLPWLFHYWLLGGVIFYGFGAQELVINIWSFHIVDPAFGRLVCT